MGAVHKAKMLQRDVSTYEAALYLNRKGYSLKAARHILLGV